MKIAWLEGDGIGPEITSACRHVLQHADDCFDLQLQYEHIDIGIKALEQTAMLLDWYGERISVHKYKLAATAINNALEELLTDREKCTIDLGGKASTECFAASIADCLQANSA